MANGYFERGEVYWIRMDSGFGYEQGVGRPGVILSCNEQNNASGTVTIAFTSKQRQNSWEAEIEATGCVAYVKVSQIVTVDKTRLGKCIGVLNRSEMNEVDKLLEYYFDLGYVDDTAVKEKETEISVRDIQIKELREEIAKLKAEVAAHADDEMAVKVEIAMWQRLYEKALDQLCSMKLTGDVIRRAEKKAPVVEVAPKETVKVEPVVEDEPKLVDINTAKFDELKKCGLSSNVVLSVINGRPYKSVTDLKKVPGFTSTMYGIMSKKLCCVMQPKPKKVTSALVEPDPGYETETAKVNINTAKAKEIMEVLGCGNNAAYAITSYRNQNGLFTRVEELLSVRYWTESLLKKHRSKLEV